MDTPAGPIPGELNAAKAGFSRAKIESIAGAADRRKSGPISAIKSTAFLQPGSRLESLLKSK
jgi:hypothetical protein